MTLAPDIRKRARNAAAVLDAELSVREQNRAYAAHTVTGPTANHPTLHLDDVSAIPFLLGISGVEEYQHRAQVRARDGDLFATVTPSVPGYPAYCAETLRFGRATGVLAEPLPNKLAVARACSRGTAFQEVCAAAKAAGGLTIHPYMSIAPVWRLALLVAQEAGVDVRVIGPPPPVTALANDKALLGELVGRVLGPAAIVATHRSSCPSALTRHLLALSEGGERVALKRTRCASAMGNEVHRSAALREAGPDGVERIVRAFLERTEWDGSEEVLAVAWEETELSPSTQLWIPPLGHGDPLLEGVYDQILDGPHRVFVGSRPSVLPEAVRARLGSWSLEVACALQQMGYVGRCSFDLLVLGDPDGDFQLRFTECNGRWGGTSIPMSMVDRLRGAPRPCYRAQDFIHPGLVGARFEDVLARTGDGLFDPATGEGRFVFYNVGPMAGSGKLDVIAFGATPDEADAALLQELPRRLGLS